MLFALCDGVGRMSSVSALLRDLETTMVRGASHERVQILARLTDLFVSAAAGMGVRRTSWIEWPDGWSNWKRVA